MWIAPMAGHAADGGDDRAFVIFIEAKIFLVDLTGHLVHMTGDILLRFGIAGEIEMMRGAVGRWRVAKAALHPQRRFPAVHDLIEIFVADVLWQDLQILRSRFRWTGGGHSDDRQGRNRDEDCNFLVMKHMGNFGTVR
jgi:hypothetical protein